MNLPTYADIGGLFTNELNSHGIKPTCPIIADGKLHRCHVDGDKAGSRNLAYVLHTDGRPAGWFQHFKTGVTGTWKLDGKPEPMTAEMRRQVEYAKQVRQKEQAKSHSKAASRALEIWRKSKTIKRQDTHPYLLRKHIQPHGVRLYGTALVIPLTNSTGAMVNLQFITPDGEKRFLPGGRKKGSFFTIGEPTETLLICEGFATGASLYENTGKQTIVAFDAGNLQPVAQAIRAKFPNAEIILCGDNDNHGKGQQSANEAALAIGGKMLSPPDVDTDWNDYYTHKAVAHG